MKKVINNIGGEMINKIKIREYVMNITNEKGDK